MLRSVGLAVSVALAALLLAGGGIWLLTRDVTMLNQRTIESAQASASAVDKDALDASAEVGQSDEAVALEARRQQAQKDAMAWLSASIAGGLVGAVLWLTIARQISKKVTGVKGQTSAGPAWWGVFVGLCIYSAVVGYWTIIRHGFGDAASANVLNVATLSVVAASIAAYYLGTAIAVPRLMRPSVPLATLWQR